MKKITIFILFLLGAPQISGNNNYPIITNHDIYKLYREMYAEKVKKLTSDCEKYVQEKEVCIAKRNEIYKGTINKYEALIQDQNRSIEKINNTLDDIEKLLNEKAEVEDENFMQCIKNPTSECRKKYVHFRKAITELPETEITLKFKQAFNYSDSAH